MPANVAASPKSMLNPRFENAYKYCSLRRSETVSCENVEKVVNPPKMPVAKKSLHSAFIFPFSVRPYTNPIKKQPSTFTANVPKGKFDKYRLLI